LTQEFFRPIVTPFELQIALGVVAAWDGRYLLEFEKVLGEVALEAGSEDANQDDEPEFSLITGKYRQVKKYGDKTSTSQIGEEEGALVRRNHQGTITKSMVSAAG
jgi:diphthamide biosynthesis protein 2